MFISLLAGGTHYIYQLIAARFLSFEDFGRFSGWLAWVYLGLSVAAFSQYAANFFPVFEKGLKRSILLTGLLAVVTLSLLLSFPNLNPVGVGVLALVVAPFTNWLLGQTQRRLLLLSFALGGMIIGLAKVLVVFVLPQSSDLQKFYWAIPLCYVAGSLFLFPVLWRNRNKALDNVKKMGSIWKEGVWSAFVLSFLTVYIPNVDLLFVERSQDSFILSQFAQVSLFYKVIFFVFLIFSQWILPQQLEQGNSNEASPRRMKNFVRICVMGLGFSLCASAVAKDFYSLVLNREFQAPQVWIFLSCFNMAMFTGLFLEIQRQIAALRIKDASYALFIHMGVVILSLILNLDLIRYLQVQVLTNGILLFLLILGAGRIFASQVVDQG